MAATPVALAPCALVDQGAQTYGLRISALFGILAVSSVGGWLPLLLSLRNDVARPFFLLSCLGGGVVLATGFIHILPDGEDSLSDPCLGFSSTYPWAQAFAGGSALTFFMLEFFTKQWVRRRCGLPALTEVPEHDFSVFARIPDTEVVDGEKEKAQAAYYASNYVAALMLEAGVIFHSIFIGIDLGINTVPGVVRPLMIALMFHQACEGIALGAAFVRANFSTLKYCMFMMIYVLITPIGIAIGIAVSSSYNSESPTALGFKGSFNAVSAGILIYNALADILIPVFNGNPLLAESPVMQLFGFFSAYAGYCIMGLIGKWA